MKKIVLAMATVIMMATSVMAQDAEQKGERRQFNPEEMIQKRTDETVKKYGLDKDQAAKLLDLNKKYAGRIGQRGGRMGRGNHGGRPGEMRGNRGGENRDTLKRRPVQAPSEVKNDRPKAPEGMKVMEEYEAELKTIMTEKQYEAYSADRKKMMENRRGQRQRNN